MRPFQRRDLLALQNTDPTNTLNFALGAAAADDGTSLQLQSGQMVKFDVPGAAPASGVHVTGAAGTKWVLMWGQLGVIE